jgi:hypothetical protein
MQFVNATLNLPNLLLSLLDNSLLVGKVIRIDGRCKLNLLLQLLLLWGSGGRACCFVLFGSDCGLLCGIDDRALALSREFLRALESNEGQLEVMRGLLQRGLLCWLVRL